MPWRQDAAVTHGIGAAGMAPQGGPTQGGGYGAAANGGYGAAAPANSGVYGSGGSVGATGVVRPYGQPPPAATSAYGGVQTTKHSFCRVCANMGQG